MTNGENRMDALGGRFNRSESDEDDYEDPDADSEPSGDESENRDASDDSADTVDEQTRNVKDRPHRTVYLPDDLHDSVDDAAKRIIYEADMEHDIELGKNRFVIPTIMFLGVDQVEEMEIGEVLDAMRDEEMLVSPPEWE